MGYRHGRLAKSSLTGRLFPPILGRGE